VAPRNDDISLILTKAKKQGFLPDVSDNELNALEAEARQFNEGDIHPEPTDLAVGQSTFSRMFITSSGVVTTSGNVRFTYFTATKTETISQIQVTSGTTAAGATPTKVRFGIYTEAANGDLTLVASTPNDTTLLAATSTLYTKALSVPVTLVRGQRYAFGYHIETAATVPTTMGFIISNGATAFIAPRLAGATGSSDLPATVLNAAIGISSQLTYATFLP
jgi:hypothetical protein